MMKTEEMFRAGILRGIARYVIDKRIPLPDEAVKWIESDILKIVKNNGTVEQIREVQNIIGSDKGLNEWIGRL